MVAVLSGNNGRPLPNTQPIGTLMTLMTGFGTTGSALGPLGRRSRIHEPTTTRRLNSTAPVTKIAEKGRGGEEAKNLPHNDEQGRSGQRKRLDVAIVGAPNAGKSQLLNAIMGTTVSAVSRKRHTTRAQTNNAIRGAWTTFDTQVVFIDTPGFVTYRQGGRDGIPVDLLEETTKKTLVADYTLIVIDSAKKITAELKRALAFLMFRAIHASTRAEFNLEQNYNQHHQPRLTERFAIVLNKVDLVHPKNKLLDLANHLGHLADACVQYRHLHDQTDFFALLDSTKNHNDNQQLMEYLLHHTQPSDTQNHNFDWLHACPPVFYTAAIHGQNDHGVQDLLQHLLTQATPTYDEWPLPSDHLYPHVTNDNHDTFPDSSKITLQRIEEIIREKIYRCLHQEVPHQIQQVNRLYVVESNHQTAPLVRIDQDLLVRTESHRRLVIGKRGGQTIRRIRETAHRDLCRHVFPPHYQVILNLHVKLNSKSSKRPRDLMSHHSSLLSQRINTT